MKRRPASNGNAGYALIAVLLVLLALLALLAPYLTGIRRADQGSATRLDQAAGRLALDDAARHARAVLDRTHGAFDPTPYWDSEAELEVDGSFSLPPREGREGDAPGQAGVSWDLDAQDLTGRIDLASASPGVLANLLGCSTWLTRAASDQETELACATTHGFPEQGFLSLGGERIAYRATGAGAFANLERGLFAAAERSGAGGCSPGAPRGHGAGAPVTGLAAWAIPAWRIAGGTGELRVFDGPDRVGAVFAESLGGALERGALARLCDATTPFGDAGAGARWQRAARVVSSVDGGVDCTVSVDEWRWFNPGTTVLVTDGRARELAIVRRSLGSLIELTDVLANDYDAYRAEIRALARRPVNVNTAGPAVLRALVFGLKRAGVNARITDREADLLVEAIVTSRPFTGFQDFARRVVLPAAGIEELPPDAPVRPPIWDEVGPGGFIDLEDAQALYQNALNANDADLEFSTMPFAFTSRGTFALSLRSSVNAKSGIERVANVREQVEVVVPQAELFALWARQEDFDEELRLSREAPWWSTGPEATSRFTSGGSPPSRFAANFGSLADSPMDGFEAMPGAGRPAPPLSSGEHFRRTFASRADEGFARLATLRVEEVAISGHGRFVEHFDFEDGELEGRGIAAAGIYYAVPDDARVRWSDGPDDLLRPFSFSMWIEPASLLQGDFLLDLGGAYDDADRVSLAVDGTELVLRVLDGAGDHPGSTTLEETQARLPLARLPTDTWSHVSVDVHGSRPDQVTLLVDGMARAETAGLTRLAAPLGETDALVRVESTAGFGALGDTCVLRIGQELIEAELRDEHTFTAFPSQSGVKAGTGGRLARELWITGFGPEGATAPRSYAAGTPVMLYGYSMPLWSAVPPGSARLPAALGAFAVAVVTEVEGGDTALGDNIWVHDPQAATDKVVGVGLEGAASKATALVLARADDPKGGDTSFMEAFDPRGGFAALVQAPIAIGSGVTTSGARLGGLEVIRYSGRQGDRLQIAARGQVVDAELANQLDQTLGLFGARAFVHDFGDTLDDTSFDEELWAQVFVVPISLSVPGVFPAPPNVQFLDPEFGPQYAQITRLGNETELTEWVRYDAIAAQTAGSPSQLVRNSPAALAALHGTATLGRAISAGFLFQPTTPPPTSGPPPGVTGGGAGGGGHGGGSGGGSSASAPSTKSVAPAAASAQDAGGSNLLDQVGWLWQSDLGKPADQGFPLTHAVRTAFGFRGVLGTHSHAHPLGTVVLPVFRTFGRKFDRGAPSRGDRAWILREDDDDPGTPVVVHNAHVPDDEHQVHQWEDTDGNFAADPAGVRTAPQPEFEGVLAGSQTLVALRDAAPSLVTPTQGFLAQPTQAVDMRTVARLVKFPTGELPRAVTSIAVGGAFRVGGTALRALVDELEFGSTEFAELLAPDEVTRGAGLVLAQSLGVSDLSLEVEPEGLAITQGIIGTAVPVLLELPERGGLLRIGEEIVAFRSRDPEGGRITLAANGRGLLGTRAQAHALRESVHFLSHLQASYLADDVAPGAAELPLGGLQGFPRSGTLLVGEELVHYPRRTPADGAGSVSMPRASSEPGRSDAEGRGLFRGRFGTSADGQVEGAAVILFPCRYWDRWTERADAPELAYFGFDVAQEDAWWRTAFFEETESAHAGVALGVLVRGDASVPWDADPEQTQGLWLFGGEEDEGERLELGIQSDRLELRVFARYRAGAFDFTDGRAHGWKSTPDLLRVGAEYIAPRTVLAREER